MDIRLDGRTAFAATGGRPFDPTLPAVVFIHGSGLDHSVWALHSRWFAYHGRTVLALDLPGHGRSDGETLPTIAAMADWVAAVIAAAGLAQAALVGHSMGALVALEAAARHPKRVRALGLVGAAAAIPVHPDLLAASAANDHAAIDMVAIWGHGQHAGLGGSRAPGLWMLGGAIRVLERAKPGVLGTDLAACDSYRDGTQAAAKVTQPTALVLGERDLMTPLKAGRALAALIPSSRTVTLPGAGHMLMAEHPDAVLKALAGTV